ncbi:MAG: hypothetical protein HYZ28_19195 [Myxococcales bacterium]|nr:hypothetical protein [Myxococcales bacterium]
MRRLGQAVLALSFCQALAGCSGCRGGEQQSAERFLEEVRSRFPAAAERLRESPLPRAGEGKAEGAGDWLEVRTPRQADQPLVVGWGGVHLRIRATGAAASARAEASGVAVYRGVHPDTDALQVATRDRAEELLLLRSPRAPSRFEYEVAVEGGSLRASGAVVDSKGVEQLRLARPWAIDAKGRRLDASLSIDRGRVSVALDASGLEYPVLLDPVWEKTVGALGTARYDYALALLGDGRVLACGGTEDGTNALLSCELYDAFSGKWSATAPMAEARRNATATLLPTGKVLVCGGGAASCQLYDAVSGSWATAPAMAAVRASASAVLLDNGKVLMVGGDAGGTAELFDASAGTWSSAGSITARSGMAAAKLGGGKVLVTGGVSAGAPVATVDVYDSAGNSWSAGNPLPAARAEQVAVRLRNGKVLVAGGTDGSATLDTAVLYDEAAGTWSAQVSMVKARRRHAAVLLPSGRALLLGGNDGTAALPSAEVFEPSSGKFAAMAPLRVAREGAGAAVLPSGDVLVAGGLAGTALADSERYTLAPVWSPTNPMSVPRRWPTVTVLGNGKALVAGGESQTAELFDPATGLWSPAAMMNWWRGRWQAAMLLPSGRVLVAGYGSPSEEYDPATNSWSAGPGFASNPLYDYQMIRLPDGRVLAACAWPTQSFVYSCGGPCTWQTTLQTLVYRPKCAAALLPNGRVLFAGGQTQAVEIWDPASGAYSLASPMAREHTRHTATPTLNGKVVVAGGLSGGWSTNSVEVYDPSSGTWADVASMVAQRHGHRALPLPSGRVLVVGGYVGTDGAGTPLASAEIYDPQNDTWQPAWTMTQARGEHDAALLPTGDVLMVGGAGATAERYYESAGGWTRTGSPTQAIDPLVVSLLPTGKVLAISSQLAELYDPASGLWSPAPLMPQWRDRFTATLLASGKLLVAGGCWGCPSLLYDPWSGDWSPAAGMLVDGRSGHSAVLLSNGMLLVAGGSATNSYLAAAELYDPSTDRWASTGSLTEGRRDFPMVLLPSGKVLATHGRVSGGLAVNSDVYDPSSATWTATGFVPQPRENTAAVLLPTGKALVVGGYASPDYLATADLYDPEANSWATAAAMREPRRFHSGLLLASGKVLVAHGVRGPSSTNGAELYDSSANRWVSVGPLISARSSTSMVLLPTGRVLVIGPTPYVQEPAELSDPFVDLTGATRPSLTSAPSWAAQGDAVTLSGSGFRGGYSAAGGTAPGAAADLPVVALSPLSSGSLRWLPPSTFSDASLTFTVPADQSNGFHRLSVMVAGVPSHSRIIRIGYGTVGAPCTAGADCESQNCVDGACCATPSCATCESCKAPGWTSGFCAKLSFGAEDSVPAAACEGTSACDGDGGCKLRNTRPCGASSDCLYGLCVDGYCCTGPCDGGCQACDVAGKEGFCTSVAKWGNDPDTCDAGGGVACDGLGACKKIPGEQCTAVTECVSGYCVDRFCCDVACTSACEACNLPGDAGRCGVALQGTQGACDPIRACDGLGSCRLKNGQACALDGDCAYAHCADGVCCDSSCTADCRACNLAGSIGACSYVPNGGTDPGTCSAPNACDGLGTCKKLPGQPCASPSDCASGFCVDGYCCSTSCTGTCQACNLSGQLGNCGPVAQGQTDMGTCMGPASACDGLGRCKLVLGQACAAVADCLSGNCVDGVCCANSCASVCQACNVVGSFGACSPVPAGQTDPSTCVAPDACDGAGACKKPQGAACAAATECASSFCVDGFCCDSACQGTCQACDNPGGVGICGPVANGKGDVGTCTSPSACDGAGGCKGLNGLACAAVTDCLSASCVDGVCCDSSCAGTCKACNLAGKQGVCSDVSSGQTDDTCAAPAACDAVGTCKLAQGSACSAAGDCASGFCADGVCCASACTGTCQACNLLGQCAPVAKGLSDAPSCVGTSACDGAGNCQKVLGQGCAISSDCLSGFCADGVCCDAACGADCKACNVPGSLGVCSDVSAGYVDGACTGLRACDGKGTCKSALGRACAAASECLSGNCVAGTCCNAGCQPGGCVEGVRCNAEACTLPSECASGNCADGVCCDTACSGTCAACDLAGRAGKCSSVPKGQTDVGTCEVPNACDGAGQCSMKPIGAACQSAAVCMSGFCVDGVCCDSSCDGTCEACNVAERLGTCSRAPVGKSDIGTCEPPKACDAAGACSLLMPGQACTAASQCTTGHCIDGYCCESACTAECKACNLAGLEGSCADVPRDSTDVGTCAGSGDACDGAGKCRLKDGQPCLAGYLCASGVCADGVCCNAACDGACFACTVAGAVGQCSPVPRGQTDPTVCNAPWLCDGAGSCRKGLGQGCAAGEECVSGSCLRGVCAEEALAERNPNVFALSCGCHSGGPTVAAGLFALLLLLRRARRALPSLLLLLAVAASGESNAAPSKRKKPATPASATAAPAEVEVTPLVPSASSDSPAPPLAGKPTPASATAPPKAEGSSAPPAATVSPKTPDSSLTSTAQPTGSQPPPGTPTPPETVKVAILALQAGPGVDSKTAELVSEAFVASIHDRPRVQAISSSDIQAVLSFERQRQLLGCSDSGCLAEIGGAIGADKLVSGTLGKLGTTMVFTVQLFDAKKGVAEKRFTTEIQSASEEAFLDAAASAALELFGPSPVARRKVVRARFSFFARIQATPDRTPAGAVVALAGYEIVPSLTASLGALGTSYPGALARLSWVPFNAEGKLRPVLAVELAALLTDPIASLGPGLSVGLEYAPVRWLSVGLEVPALYLLAAPTWARRGYVFAGPTVAVRL